MIAPGSYGGRYIHYGIREHGMAAAMNGMALHGGFAPAGGTFLVFTDYARPAMRIAALAGIPVIYVMTHDSIGLGEDGPTHQPVEHLAALRAMPNMRVFRPADAMETAECWQLAIERTDGPTVLALTRQNVIPVRKAADGDNLCARGAYELAPADGTARATIFATGSEMELALECAIGPQAARRRGPRRLGSVPRSVPEAAGRLSRQGDRHGARSRSRSKPAFASAGMRSSARTAASSAWRASARARPIRMFTRISESPPKRWSTRY